ncbi:hypothetical protein GCM10009430_08000 [Aquimarina litoralis]|uniref:Class IIb bacteriocin, lactobin A/cerein 7B family n=1 Tax=Aquimarina litoralis TaxID=584605 RepID=A0ABN1IIM8_9FLAO
MNLEKFKQKELNSREMNSVKGGTLFCYLGVVIEVVVDQVIDGFTDGAAAGTQGDD